MNPAQEVLRHLLAGFAYLNTAPRGLSLYIQPPALRSHVRHSRERVPAAVLAPVSIWFIVSMLKPATYVHPKTFSYMFMVIDDSHRFFLIATNHSSCINWPYSFTCLTTFIAHSDPSRQDVQSCNSRQGEMRDVTMEESRRRRSIWWRFRMYFVVNTCDTTLFSHVKIGIDHCREGVTATTPS